MTKSGAHQPMHSALLAGPIVNSDSLSEDVREAYLFGCVSSREWDERPGKGYVPKLFIHQKGVKIRKNFKKSSRFAEIQQKCQG